jgi:uncharacterized protein YyaL (SSP411 family)
MAPQMLVAVGRWLAAPEQVIVRRQSVDAETHRILAAYRKDFRPYTVLVPLSDEAVKELAELAPFLAGLERKGEFTVYECRNFACELPKVFGAANSSF